MKTRHQRRHDVYEQEPAIPWNLHHISAMSEGRIQESQTRCPTKPHGHWGSPFHPFPAGKAAEAQAVALRGLRWSLKNGCRAMILDLLRFKLPCRNWLSLPPGSGAYSKGFLIYQQLEIYWSYPWIPVMMVTFFPST